MSKQRQKGTLHETNVVAFLRDNGFPYAERRALNGQFDKGDITGCGPLVPVRVVLVQVPVRVVRVLRVLFLVRQTFFIYVR